MMDRDRFGTTLVLPSHVDAVSRSGVAHVPLGTNVLVDQLQSSSLMV
jgi:hypothetical protein